MEVSKIISQMKAMWKKLNDKLYRDAFSSAKTDDSIAFQIHFLREARG